jgi:hypothetical protein
MLRNLIADLASTTKRHFPALYGLVRDATPSAMRSRMSYDIYKRRIAADGSPESIFGKIYETGWWSSPESLSGTGSELWRSDNLRSGLLTWVEAKGIRSLLDAPCGDYNWMRHVYFPDNFHYIGGDIVEAMIENNRLHYPKLDFRKLDILSDPLPAVDAWLCRDVLIHFPNAAGRHVLERFCTSSIDYLLVTTFPGVTHNKNIEFGQYRPVNLTLAPYHLPEPEEILLDDDDPATGRIIGVWSRQKLRRAWKL